MRGEIRSHLKISPIFYKTGAGSRSRNPSKGLVASRSLLFCSSYTIELIFALHIILLYHCNTPLYSVLSSFCSWRPILLPPLLVFALIIRNSCQSSKLPRHLQQQHPLPSCLPPKRTTPPLFLPPRQPHPLPKHPRK